MRAFFCFFLVFTWVLCAQANPELEKFKSDYETLRKEIADAKDRIISVDFIWVDDHNQALFRLSGAKQVLLKSQSEAVRQEALLINIQILVDDMFFINKRRYVEHGVSKWSLQFAERQIKDLRTVVDQFNAGGLQFEYQVQQAQRIYVITIFVQAILEDKEFSSRVCVDNSTCAEKIKIAQEQVAQLLSEAKKWAKEAENWKKPG